MSCTIGMFDVDGTVTESAQVISPVMAELLASANQRLAFISGTDCKELKRMLEPLIAARPDSVYLLPEMGRTCHLANLMLYDFGQPFDADLIKKITMGASLAMESLGIIPVADDVFLRRESQLTISILGRSAPTQMKKDVDPTGSIRRKIIHSIVKFLENSGEELMPNFTLGGHSSIDIQESPWDKRDGTMAFLEYMGVHPYEVIFFGDNLQPGGNDYPMRYTGVRCVEVKDPLDTFTKLSNAKVYHD